MKTYDKDHVPRNSSMAQDLKEIEQLGKQMEKQRSNQELKREGKTPDPKQHKKEN